MFGFATLYASSSSTVRTCTSVQWALLLTSAARLLRTVTWRVGTGLVLRPLAVLWGIVLVPPATVQSMGFRCQDIGLRVMASTCLGLRHTVGGIVRTGVYGTAVWACALGCVYRVLDLGVEYSTRALCPNQQLNLRGHKYCQLSSSSFFGRDVVRGMAEWRGSALSVKV